MATNQERTATTRARLTGEARRLFARDGYSATSTEAILEAAGMRRGALYHHFADKSALLATVCSQIVDEALPVVEAAAAEGRGPRDALVRGSIAWVGFVTQEEIRRILLVDAPTVLGWKRWQALEDRLSVDALRAGIGEAIASEEISFDGDPELLATLSNGALNALALRAGDASPPVASSEWQQAIRAYWDAFANSP